MKYADFKRYDGQQWLRISFIELEPGMVFWSSNDPENIYICRSTPYEAEIETEEHAILMKVSAARLDSIPLPLLPSS